MGQAFHAGPWLGRTILRPLVESAFLYAKWKYGLDLRLVSPEDAVAATKVPVLLIHGQNDTNIPIRHSRRIAAHNPNVILWEVPNAQHADAIGAAPQEFQGRLDPMASESLPVNHPSPRREQDNQLGRKSWPPGRCTTAPQGGVVGLADRQRNRQGRRRYRRLSEGRMYSVATTTVPHKKTEREARKDMSHFIDEVVNVIESTPVKSTRRRKTTGFFFSPRTAARKASAYCLNISSSSFFFSAGRCSCVSSQ